MQIKGGKKGKKRKIPHNSDFVNARDNFTTRFKGIRIRNSLRALENRRLWTP